MSRMLRHSIATAPLHRPRRPLAAMCIPLLKIVPHHFEAIAERSHIRILLTTQLKGVRYNLNGLRKLVHVFVMRQIKTYPMIDRGIESSLKKKSKIARMLWIKAKRIRRPFGISLGKRGKPLLDTFHILVLQEFSMRRHLVHLTGHGLDVLNNQFVQVTVRVFALNTLEEALVELQF